MYCYFNKVHLKALYRSPALHDLHIYSKLRRFIILMYGVEFYMNMHVAFMMRFVDFEDDLSNCAVRMCVCMGWIIYRLGAVVPSRADNVLLKLLNRPVLLAQMWNSTHLHISEVIRTPFAGQTYKGTSLTLIVSTSLRDRWRLVYATGDTFRTSIMTI